MPCANNDLYMIVQPELTYRTREHRVSVVCLSLLTENYEQLNIESQVGSAVFLATSRVLADDIYIKLTHPLGTGHKYDCSFVYNLYCLPQGVAGGSSC